MFENALQAEHKGTHWGVIAGALTFAILLVAGYFLVNPVV